MLQRGFLFHYVLSGRKMLETRQILIYRNTDTIHIEFSRDVSRDISRNIGLHRWIDFSFFFFK